MLESPKVGTGSSFKTRFRQPFQDDIFDAVLSAKFAFDGFVAILIDDIHIRPQTQDFRLGIHPTVAGGNDGLMDETNGGNHITAMGLTEEGMAGSLEFSEVLIVPDDDDQIAQFGAFLEETDMAGMKPVETAGDHDFFLFE